MKVVGMAVAAACLLCGPCAQPRAQEPAAPATQNVVEVAAVHGVVLDADGDAVVGASVTLRVGTNGEERKATTDEGGNFSFEKVAPGSYVLKVVEDGLEDVESKGVLKPGEVLTLEAIGMRVKNVMTEVDVLPSDQVAAIQVHEEEKQRLLGVIPNFYVVYDKNAAPMTTKLKYQMVWRNYIDPVNVGLVAASAGIEQAEGEFSGFGPGWSGYGKRVGAGLADFAIGSALTGAVLPQVFHQDPRYFYKGTGTVWERVKYALAMAVVCKGDNGKWQPCYSNVLGSFAAAGASNLYYPASDRRGAILTLQLGAEGIGGDAINNLVEEFLLKRLTPKAHNHGADAPGN